MPPACTGGGGEEILSLGDRSSGLVGEDVAIQWNPTCTVCEVSALPCNAPIWFDALDSGVLYVLEGEVLPDLGAVHAHADQHFANPRQGRGGVTHYLRHGPSTREA